METPARPSDTINIPGFDAAVEAVRKAKNILVLTGAGISAESGIPTFRGKDGWWKSRNPQELATMTAFRADPRFVWEWYDYRRGLVANAEPNAAHRALAWMESVGKNVFIITQNVDDLHERGGSRHVVHIHGSIWSMICMKEGKRFEDRRVPLPELPPLCDCGAIMRPGVVWFDEELPREACAEIGSYFARTAPEVVFVVGTYVTFDYIAAWAVEAKRKGALLIEVNPDETVLSSRADVVLRGKAGEIFRAIQERLSATGASS